MKKIIFIIVVVLVVLFVVSQKSENITNEDIISNTNGGTEGLSVKVNAGYQTMSIVDVQGVSRIFNFNVAVLESWSVVAVANGTEINFYNPASPKKGAREQSQIYLTSFVANDFQVPEGISVLSREDHEVSKRPAVSHVISPKNSNDFSGQPSWRNGTHKTTSVRLQDDNPSRFYVFVKNPDLAESEFQRFLNSIEL